MQNLTASIPHQLTRAQAKRRIQDGMVKLRRDQAAVLGNVQESWRGDTMEFSGGVMGQSISGRLDVQDKTVQVEVALSGLLGMAAAALMQFHAAFCAIGS